ncbi:MAG: methyltransferase [Oscillibacter sp.]|nr:methyltransferase [Oscillibacter sp.]MBQ2996864.1 methyltransferase [Oscillibacter sp.]
MEHWEVLCPGGLKMVYDDTLFRPGTDSFLLSSLPRLKAGLRVCDLGCGTGLLGLLLLQRQREIHVTGVELNEKAAALARRCAAENGIEDRFSILHGDFREVRHHFSTGSFDLCVCNPPYYEPERGKVSADLGSARSELTCTLEDVCAAAAFLLRWGGSFCLVHKPERLTDVLCTLRSHKIEPKQLRFVCKNAVSAPSLILCEGRRGGNSGLTLLPPLLLDTPEGRAELDTIYFRKEGPQP